MNLIIGAPQGNGEGACDVWDRFPLEINDDTRHDP